MQQVMIDTNILQDVEITKHRDGDACVVNIDFKGKYVLLCFSSPINVILLSKDLWVTVDKDSIRYSTSNTEHLQFGALSLDENMSILNITDITSNSIKKDNDGNNVDCYDICIDRYTSEDLRNEYTLVPLVNDDDI